MSDPFAEIKERAADPKIPWQRADFVWLIGEIERLRAERYVDSEVVALRAEVDVLVSACVAKDADILVLKTALAQIDEFCAEVERQDGPRASLPTKWLRKHVDIATAGRALTGQEPTRGD